MGVLHLNTLFVSIKSLLIRQTFRVILNHGVFVRGMSIPGVNSRGGGHNRQMGQLKVNVISCKDVTT